MGENIAWHWGFAAAGVVMAAATAIYFVGAGRFFTDRVPPQGRLPDDPAASDAAEQGSVVRIVILAAILSVLLAPNFQIFNTYMLWGDAAFDLVLAGWRIPTSWLIMADAVASIIVIAGSVRFWQWWRASRAEPDDLAKMMIGSAIVVGGMLMLALAAARVDPGEKISLAIPLLFHLINAIGYAQILPVALTAFSRLAPPGLESTSMGLFYLTYAGANALASWIGSHYVTSGVAWFWLSHALIAAAGGLALFLLRRTMPAH